MVGGGKARGATGDADERFKNEAGGGGVGIGADYVALVIDVGDAEAGINGGLVGVGGGSGEIVEVEAAKN